MQLESAVIDFVWLLSEVEKLPLEVQGAYVPHSQWPIAGDASVGLFASCKSRVTRSA